MKYLQRAMGFHIELPDAQFVAVKGYKLTPGIVPCTYGDIMGDLPLVQGGTLETLSFHEVFEDLLTKSTFFLQDKMLGNKNLFFLRKCTVNNTYHWVHIRAWSEDTHCLEQNPNGNFFVEPWRNSVDHKHLLEDSLFFVCHSKKELAH